MCDRGLAVPGSHRFCIPLILNVKDNMSILFGGIKAVIKGSKSICLMTSPTRIEMVKHGVIVTKNIRSPF